MKIVITKTSDKDFFQIMYLSEDTSFKAMINTLREMVGSERYQGFIIKNIHDHYDDPNIYSDIEYAVEIYDDWRE